MLHRPNVTIEPFQHFWLVCQFPVCLSIPGNPSDAFQRLVKPQESEDESEPLQHQRLPLRLAERSAMSLPICASSSPAWIAFATAS